MWPPHRLGTREQRVLQPHRPPRLSIETLDAPVLRRSRHDIWARTVGRLEQEAHLLGADGVVAVRIERREIAEDVRELVLIGTAVRSSTSRRPPVRAFSCALSGQENAAALRAGLMPVRLVAGIAAMVRHDLRTPRDSWRSDVELTGFTTLSTSARAAARERVATATAASGASDFVLGGHDVEVTTRECPAGGSDHRMVATLVGTALTRFAGHGAPRVDALPVLRLDARGQARPDSLALATRVGTR